MQLQLLLHSLTNLPVRSLAVLVQLWSCCQLHMPLLLQLMGVLLLQLTGHLTPGQHTVPLLPQPPPLLPLLLRQLVLHLDTHLLLHLPLPLMYTVQHPQLWWQHRHKSAQYWGQLLLLLQGLQQSRQAPLLLQLLALLPTVPQTGLLPLLQEPLMLLQQQQ
jgi:hypothetical protein